MDILFITSTRIGDAVLSTGLLEHIAQHYPQAKVTVACGWLASSLFEGFPQVSRVIAMKKEKNAGHWIELWKQVVRIRWDIVVDLRNSAVSRLIWAGQRYIFGPHIDQSKHKVEQMAQVMRLSDVPSPKLYFSPSQREKAAQWMPKHEYIVGVGPAANWIGKTWPADRFIEVLKVLTDEQGCFPKAAIAVFAAPGEESQAYAVLNAFPKDRQIDVIAKGTPGEVAACIQACDFFIGNDSGLMHCAAASGVTTFGVFGPSYPHLYSPWGDNAAYVQTPETFDQLIDFDGYDPKTLKHTLMTSLAVDDVLKAIAGFLAVRGRA